MTIDLPVGAERILSDAAARCQMTPELLCRALLIEAADMLLENERERRYYDAERLMLGVQVAA